MEIRVGGILYHNHKILMINRDGTLTFSDLPTSEQETLEACIRKFFMENLGIEVSVEKLIYMIQFVRKGEKKPYKLTYFFLVKPISNIKEDFVVNLKKVNFKWVGAEDLERFKIVPKVLKHFLSEDLKSDEFKMRIGVEIDNNSKS